jgi:uncharacterized protein (DUF2249 family)
MRPGDEVQLSGTADPGPVWQRLARANPGGYGFETLENGPTRWRLKIKRTEEVPAYYFAQTRMPASAAVLAREDMSPLSS